jgi:hypothetical protein
MDIVGTNASPAPGFRDVSVTIVERAEVVHEQRHAVNMFLGVFSTDLLKRVA